jgi:uncharacterized protein (DUF697 family)
LFMVLGIVYSWQRWRNKGLAHILLIVLLYGGVALLWLVVVPQLTQSPLSSIRFVHPEIGYAILASAVLGFGWSVIFTVMNLRARRAN